MGRERDNWLTKANKVIDGIRKGLGRAEAARLAHIHRETLANWLNRADKLEKSHRGEHPTCVHSCKTCIEIERYREFARKFEDARLAHDVEMLRKLKALSVGK